MTVDGRGNVTSALPVIEPDTLCYFGSLNDGVIVESQGDHTNTWLKCVVPKIPR
jgi:hypothetical protein